MTRGEMLAARAVALGLFTALASAGVHQLVARPLLRLAHVGAVAVTHHDPTALVLPLDELVIAGAAVALAVCWLWLLLGVVSTVLAAVTSRFTPGRASAGPGLRLTRGIGPRWVRWLTAVALGVTALQAPALAGTSGEGVAPAVSTGILTGLRLPDRAVAVATGPPTLPRTRPSPARVRVVAGDSLWSIAAALLPPDASPVEVDRAWRRIADANPDAVGPDPDLIFPGTTLRVPPLDRPLGKERP